MALGVVSGLALIGVLVADGNSTDSQRTTTTSTAAAIAPGNWSERFPLGAAQVHEEIATSTDCAALQTTFDRAAENNERYKPGTHLRTVTLEYMEHADERMRAVGCYR